MVEKPDMTPPPKPPGDSPAQAPSSKGSGGVYYKGGQIHAKPMTFLGMHFDAKEAQQLWNIMIQNINNQISKESSKMLKAIKKLKKSETGQDD